MKKILSILLILLTLCLIFTSCRNNLDTDENTNKDTNSTIPFDTSSNLTADSDTNTDTTANTDTNSDTSANTDTNSDTSANTDTNTDTSANIDTNADTDTDADIDTDTNTDTDTDTNIDTESDILDSSDTTVDSDNAPAEPQAPNITLTDYNENEVTLDSLKGKPIVLNFWASWCPPCKAEMPDFEEAYQKYGNDVTFVMVSHLAWGSDTVEKAKSFYEQSGYTFPVYFDTKFEGYLQYNLDSIPRTVIINADGTIYTTFAGMISYSALENAIKNCLE